MPKRLPADLLERVKSALGRHPEGLTLADLQGLLEGSASRRSLQRRLDQWLRRRAIRAEGERRGRRYFNAAPSDSKVFTPPTGSLTIASTSPAVQESVPLSTAGRDIQALVRRPMADRSPIGYQRAFLERYIPNESAYLTDTLRSHLHELGRTPDAERPAGTYARDILDRLLIDLFQKPNYRDLEDVISPLRTRMHCREMPKSCSYRRMRRASVSVTSDTAVPFAPARAVRPTLCR